MCANPGRGASTGLISKEQQWSLVAGERSYEGTDPFSTLVMETPHHGDDPMHDFHPTFPEIMRSYQYGLSVEVKKELAQLVNAFMLERAGHSDIRIFPGAK